jgi:hypothetical protein
MAHSRNHVGWSMKLKSPKPTVATVLAVKYSASTHVIGLSGS